MPEKAIISDSNAELINLYQQVSLNVDLVIASLRQHVYNEEYYYRQRAIDWRILNPAEAAARTIYLNKACFNGLYRVNRKGEFNVPFGRHKSITIVQEETLIKASKALHNAEIIQSDYYTLLDNRAEEGDFIFLDPPYLPISQYSDFKRYTKEQFYFQDQKNLRELVGRLVNRGCKIVLTNSVNSQILDLYKDFSIKVVQTNRMINSKGSARKGEDIIVSII